MKPRTVKETATLCAAGVLALALVLIPFELSPDGARNPNAKGLIWLALAGGIALGMVLGSRYFITRKRAQLELAGGEQYRRLADEDRRLADMAITAQEHTDLKLTALSVQMDDMREKLEQIQRILKEVE